MYVLFSRTIKDGKKALHKFKPENSHMTTILIQVSWNYVSGRDPTLSCISPTKPVYLQPGW